VADPGMYLGWRTYGTDLGWRTKGGRPRVADLRRRI